MKLSRKKAIELCIEAWTIHAETGCIKSELPAKHREIHNSCWFCEYSVQKNGCICDGCPLPGDNDIRCNDLYFGEWKAAYTPRTRKKYAGLFLGQIKSLRT